MAATTRAGKAANAANRYVGKDRNTPVLTDAAKSPVKSIGGVGKVLSGDVKGGFKDIANGALGGLPFNSMGGFNKAPEQQYLGGSKDALAGLREKYAAGQQSGADILNAGVGTTGTGVQMLGTAADQAARDRQNAIMASSRGSTILDQGLAGQDTALGRQAAVTRAMLATAAQQGPSAAQAQLQMGLAQTQQAMNAQAASARGGNAAAAMRMAQANGAAMAGDVNQQAAVLRAQEQQAHQAQLINAQNAAAGTYGAQGNTYGNTASLGGGIQNQGLQLAQGSTGQLGQFGANTASVGLGLASAGNQQQASYLNAETEANKAQLGTDQQHASAKKAASGGWIGTAANVIKSIF
jgi:hypothetical protein